ncbi:phage protein Gp36 family protein [Hymenobacter sp. YC55]|uniref:phage protein Gp36 family protein n=1 Tax=Hymenobacter sp. YC55 TaxID=3034019 RepID=UPI0023F70978|nr:phage protein Gp36 family protein [Hymenobacter sp. YC55]MDF7809923.1 DUF1320 family protein [Hymenobacter sp. YC55]
MPFLLKQDYGVQIKQDLLSTVIDATDSIRTEAELSAQEEIEGYLRGRYDLAACFPYLQPWNTLQQYEPGAVVHHGASAAGLQFVYVATRQSNGEAPVLPGAAVVAGPLVDDDEQQTTPAPAPAWVLKDPRRALLKTYLIDCALYLMHCRQNPRAVPQIRQDRYDAAIAWLNLVRQGKISAGLPALPDVAKDGTPNKESIRPRGGSLSPKMRNTY